MTPLVEKHRQALVELCRKYNVRRLDLFGSALCSDFNPDRSDLGFAVDFDDSAWKTLPTDTWGS